MLSLAWEKSRSLESANDVKTGEQAFSDKSCLWNAMRNLIIPHFGLTNEVCLVTDRQTQNDYCNLWRMRQGLKIQQSGVAGAK